MSGGAHTTGSNESRRPSFLASLLIAGVWTLAVVVLLGTLGVIWWLACVIAGLTAPLVSQGVYRHQANRAQRLGR